MNIPGFELRERLGEGAFSLVYRARRSADRSVVALKILNIDPTETPKARQRFLRAARASLQLPPHPRVVRIHELCEESPPFLVMEYIEGTTLETLLQVTGSLPVAEAARIALDVAQGLAHAHAHGIIHRDIKPANILLGPQGRALISDFGLAKIIAAGKTSRLTQTGHAVGTPVYMPPEQARDAKSVGVRSDLYSLGATLFHLLAGVPPFSGTGAGEILAQVMEGRHRSLPEFRNDIPESLSDLVHKMLALDPSDRPESATEVLASLDIHA